MAELVMHFGVPFLGFRLVDRSRWWWHGRLLLYSVCAVVTLCCAVPVYDHVYYRAGEHEWALDYEDRYGTDVCWSEVEYDVELGLYVIKAVKEPEGSHYRYEVYVFPRFLLGLAAFISAGLYAVIDNRRTPSEYLKERSRGKWSVV